MKVFANSIPKSGTHLLLRLLTLLEFDLVDFGGLRPSLVTEDETKTGRLLRSLLKTREPGKFLGIGPHLVSGGRLPAARARIRGRGREKVTLGVEFPRDVGRRWLQNRLGKVPENAVVSAHCAYTPQFAEVLNEEKLRAVCILRDPRDTAVSYVHYLKKLPRHPIYEDYMQLEDDHQRLMFFIRGGTLGGHTLRPLRQRYQNFLDWGREGGAAMVKFEELVGPRGGGTSADQRGAVERVIRHLDLQVEGTKIDDIQENLFGSGRTFRKGRAGGWREEFSEEHKKAVKEEAGDLLVGLGYEKDEEW